MTMITTMMERLLFLSSCTPLFVSAFVTPQGGCQYYVAPTSLIAGTTKASKTSFSFSSTSSSSSSSSSSSIIISLSSTTDTTDTSDTTDADIVALPNGLPSDHSTTAISIPASTTKSSGETYSKLRRLKDRMWVRETLEDLTAAEFACSLSVEEGEDDGDGNGNGGNDDRERRKSKRKRAVDFENVLNKLDARIEELCVLSSEEAAAKSNQMCYVLDRHIVDSVGDEGRTGSSVARSCYSLAEGSGAGCSVYTTEQREALLKRLIATRERLVDFMRGSGTMGTIIGTGANKDGNIGAVSDIDDIRSQLQPDDYVGEGDTFTPSSSSSSSKRGRSQRTLDSFDPSLYVREDGTIDWDGALQDREALKKFGSAVWSRINGLDPSDPSAANTENENTAESDEVHVHAKNSNDDVHNNSNNKAVTAKIVETDAIREKRDRLDVLAGELAEMEVKHTKLLNSAISAGQAIANVNLATIPPSLRLRIRASSDELEKKKGLVTFQTLDYELERIFTYLDGELGNFATSKGYIPLQDRLNVAEFGLLESQIDSFHSQIQQNENLDADVLAVVAEQLTDFKRRLGIDYYVTGLTFDAEAIQIWLKEIWSKAKRGFVFYVKGTRLFIDDVVFCLNLVGRALQGYTLKPREVRTLRRTFKDMITFIPVVIILLIPLSPIGHVLVFGAIQRVFPDFFPSCFTERRQNLLELYESTEYSAVVINETWQEKLVRLLQAIVFFITQLGKKLYASVGGYIEKSKEEDDDEDLN